MPEKNEHWRISPTEKQKRNLDMDLIDELNNQEEVERDSKRGNRHIWKIIALSIAIAFVFVVFASTMRIFTFPSLDFLSEHRELSTDPAITRLQEAVVIIDIPPNRQGTGFNIDSNGLIITNHHVVENSNIITVNFDQRTSFRGEKIASFPEIDLSVININGENLPTVKLEDESTLKPQDEVVTIGNPLGFPKIANKGVVRGETNLHGWSDPVILIQGPIHQGSSGSPVFNEEGNVAAIIFATVIPTQEANEYIGLAVPVNYLIEKLDEEDISW